MKRMAIFVFYDFEGIVGEYVKYLVSSLKAITEKTIIVSNGSLSKRAKQELEVFTEYIYERDNKGFDAGAYKDVFTTYLCDESFDQWDEVILLNDTFYGPVYPWQEVFEKMDSQDVDFWGMTKQECYKWPDGTILSSHIQTYFLVIRKKILLSDSFYKFWEQMKYPENHSDAVMNFEVKFTSYFSKKGFKYAVYTDVSESDFLINKSELTYEYYVTELLSITKMPLVKRSALVLDHFEKAQAALEYISSHTAYDVNLILKNLAHLEKNHQFKPFGYSQLDIFCSSYKNIYVYGNGKIGNLVGKYLQWRGIKFDGYVVSTKKENDDNNVISYNDLIMDNNTGIILALGKKNAEEVLPKIVCDIPIENLLIPNYDIG